ncbi:MAG TPA: aspartate/glutamate racemase family protein [Paenibacillaceae bacterium]
MKTIGLLGGMSWQSTVVYYRIINEAAAGRLGGLHSARMVLYSVDFAEIAELQRRDDREAAGAVLARGAQALERAGAELLLIGANTMHIAADAVQRAVRIPLLHVADAAAEAVRRAGVGRIGLLGTRFTMEKDFLKRRLTRHGLEVTVPGEEDRAAVHRIIFEELCLGIVSEDSRRRLTDIMERLIRAGAEGIVLGCTELSLIIRPEAMPYPVFDTTRIHAESAVEAALAG